MMMMVTMITTMVLLEREREGLVIREGDGDGPGGDDDCC